MRRRHWLPHRCHGAQRIQRSKNPHDAMKDAERGACVGTYFLWRMYVRAYVRVAKSGKTQRAYLFCLPLSRSTRGVGCSRSTRSRVDCSRGTYVGCFQGFSHVQDVPTDSRYVQVDSQGVQSDSTRCRWRSPEARSDSTRCLWRSPEVRSDSQGVRNDSTRSSK